MKLGIKYDIRDDGLGERLVVVGVRAQVGWELRTKKRVGDIADGLAMTDVVGLLFEQLKVDDALPVGVVNDLTLAAALEDINPAELDAPPTDAGPSPAP